MCTKCNTEISTENRRSPAAGDLAGIGHWLVPVVSVDSLRFSQIWWNRDYLRPWWMTSNHSLFSATHYNSVIPYKLRGILVELAKPQSCGLWLLSTMEKSFMDFSILQSFISLMCFTIYLLYLYLKQLSRTYETAILNIKYSNSYSTVDTTACSTDHKIMLIWLP